MDVISKISFKMITLPPDRTELEFPANFCQDFTRAQLFSQTLRSKEMAMGSGDVKKIPVDFPREKTLGALAGLQPKFGVRLIDGKFVNGLTEDELYERYDACEDLVMQLIGYCDRKLRERQAWDLPTLLTKVRGGVARKGWDLSPAEFDWIMTQVGQRIPCRSPAD